MNNLQFRAEDHSYHVNGVRLPSVTEILKDVGLIDTTHFKPEHAERGTTVHEATQFWDETGMEDDTIPEELLGYLEGWKKFREETGFEPSHIEQSFYSPQGYAGTVDRIGKTHKINPILLDIKTGPKQGWHRLQLAAYALMAKHELRIPIWEYWGVHLKRDGKYSVETYKSIEDSADWLAVLKVYQLKQGAAK
ncbi:MAG: PD-(D/E)XK nuclease family protein [Nitrospiraceae bacterium]|nr:PD-(D/E)XK nuclease family protein [Nitrospiraceae bacterium]